MISFRGTISCGYHDSLRRRNRRERERERERERRERERERERERLLKKFRMQQQGLCVKAKKSDHIHPILETLHWLPVTHHIQYKISTICFNSITGTTLSICPISFNLILQQDNYDLHLTHEPLLPPRVNTKTFGERSFSYAGPSVWNSLPQTLRHSDSTSSFKAALKTYLFNNYF